MSSEQACKKALSYLDYGTAVTIGSYIGVLKNELKQVKGLLKSTQLIDEVKDCKHQNLDYYNHGYHAICKDCKEEVY